MKLERRLDRKLAAAPQTHASRQLGAYTTFAKDSAQGIRMESMAYGVLTARLLKTCSRSLGGAPERYRLHSERVCSPATNNAVSERTRERSGLGLRITQAFLHS